MQAKILWWVLFLFGVAFFFVIYVSLTVEEFYGEPHYEIYTDAPLVTAHAWGIFDLEDNELLIGENVDERLPIASLTKLVTAETALQTIELATTTEVSWGAVATEGRAGKLEAGETIQTRELLFPLLIESSNDASEVIAEYVGRKEFISAMNERVEVIGMPDTSFSDPSGLSKENISTVRDLQTLATHLDRSEPHVFDITRLPKYIGENHTWWNNNKTSTYGGFLGGKNGYTEEAGRTQLAIFEQELSNGVSARGGNCTFRQQ